MPPPAYPELNAVLDQLVAGARRVLGENFVGAYLQGSFAVGDADEHSDVDFIVVTEREITAEQQAGLQALHRRLFALETPWAQHLEGSYIPKHALRRVDPERAPYFYLDNGATEFQRDNHDNTAVVRWSLRERGVVLAGPEPRALIDPVSPEQLRDDALWAFAEWARWSETISWSARVQSLLVLSYCRMLQTLDAGTVTSKREAGEWALGALDVRWRDLIQAALDDRPDPWAKVRRPADPRAVERTREFMEYARDVAHSQAARA